MSIRVMLAFSNRIFSEGIGKILGDDNDIVIIEVLTPGGEYTLERWKAMKPDVVLTDLTSLYNSFPEFKSGIDMPFILMDTNCGKENIVSAILKKKVSGVLLSDSDSSLLSKAIRAVAEGDTWIDKQTVKNLLFGINALTKEKTATLTVREKGVVSLIGKGYRNKEIAQKLNISEPTVKTHLHRIFQKLNIRNRSELITYAIKKNDMAEGLF
jgi:DNA-binding NarL/FixJ family response regulator